MKPCGLPIHLLVCALQAKADDSIKNLSHFHGVRVIDGRAFEERVRNG